MDRGKSSKSNSINAHTWSGFVRLFSFYLSHLGIFLCLTRPTNSPLFFANYMCVLVMYFYADFQILIAKILGKPIYWSELEFWFIPNPIFFFFFSKILIFWKYIYILMNWLYRLNSFLILAYRGGVFLFFSLSWGEDLRRGSRSLPLI